MIRLPALIALLVFTATSFQSSSRALAQGQSATTVQLPTFGVAVDAQGVFDLRRFDDPDGRLRLAQRDAARGKMPADLAAASKLRKVSLVRLERAVANLAAAGESPTEAMRYLAGLQRIQYVFVYPDSGEIVLAGPAEGWWQHPTGRIVGLTSGQPVVHLEDLVVALRTYAPGRQDRPFVGCSIDPNQAGLARLLEFQKTIPRVVNRNQLGQVAKFTAEGMQQALGMADIRVFGIDPATHFAQVMVEADYRMKLIGIGLEEPGVRMSSYLDLASGGAAGNLQRWWFTPNYQCLKASADGLALELVGQGVQLQTEDKAIGPGGQLLNAAARPNKASGQFTSSFTRNYEELSAIKPVFGQLRTLIDLLVAAVWLQQTDAYGRANWKPSHFADAGGYELSRLHAPRQVPCAVNSKVFGGRVTTAAGGGVSLLPHQALLAENRIAADAALEESYKQVGPLPQDAWWWD